MNQEWHLFISPHFDDVAFSCGGTLLNRVRSAHRTSLCTVFSRDARPMGRFALECQESKGVPHEERYLEMRSREDAAFGAKVGLTDRIELGFLEAPYRGYDSIPSLFDALREIDHDLSERISSKISNVIRDHDQRCILYMPSAIGRHVDHRLVRAAMESVVQSVPEKIASILLYEDFPYCARHPVQIAAASIYIEEIADVLDEKIENLLLYRSQIKNQFGSESEARKLVAGYAAGIAAGSIKVRFAERFETYSTAVLNT